jgi:hypothetical protein
MYIGLHVKYPLFSSDFNETWIFTTDFRQIIQYYFYENPSSGRQVVLCGRTVVTQLRVAFRKFANAPKNGSSAAIASWGLTCMIHWPFCYDVADNFRRGFDFAFSALFNCLVLTRKEKCGVLRSLFCLCGSSFQLLNIMPWPFHPKAVHFNLLQ